MLGPFQVALYRLADSTATEKLSAGTLRAPFDVTFEAVCAKFDSWPRMFVEPDGSFVWVGEEPNPAGANTAWQLDGQLYDRDERLLYLELSGTCPRAALERILAVCQITLGQALFESSREGTLQSGNEFIES